MNKLIIRNIQEGDDDLTFVDKINNNFKLLKEYKGGPYGNIGKTGTQGDTGEKGDIGSFGEPGERGSKWIICNSIPPSNYKKGDLWLNTSNENIIYSFDGEDWTNNKKINIISQDLIKRVDNIFNRNSYDYNGYFLSSINPEKYNIVIGDYNISSKSGNSNPQYSKFVINTNGSTRPNILEFSKKSTTDDNNPIFQWDNIDNINNKYDLSFLNGGKFDINATNDTFILKTLFNNNEGNLNFTSKDFKLNVIGGDILSINALNKIILNTNILKLETKNFNYDETNNIFIGDTKFIINNVLTIESGSSSNSNIYYKNDLPSDHFSRLFKVISNNSILVNISNNGEFYYNKKINSVQNTEPNKTGFRDTCTWTIIFPDNLDNLDVSPDTTQSICFKNGYDIVLNNAQQTQTQARGISIWANPIKAFGKLLSTLNTSQVIKFRIQTTGDTKYLYLNKNALYSHIIDNISLDPVSSSYVSLPGGALFFDIKIMNIKSPGGLPVIKLFYREYGGLLTGFTSGCLE